MTRLLVCILFLPLLAQAQSSRFSNLITDRLTFTTGYAQAFSYSGHAGVREDEFRGNIFNLKQDLGMRRWISPYAGVRYQLNTRNKASLQVSVHRLYGSATLPGEAWYNGTHLQGYTQATIDKTQFMTIDLGWEHLLLQKGPFSFNLNTAVIYDRLVFHIDAPVVPGTPRNETFERFSRQQLPLPNAGFSASWKVTGNLGIRASIRGTYLPLAKTWFHEGGSVYWKQQNMDAAIEAGYRSGKISFQAGYWYRYYSLFQESREDTNDFLIRGSGIKAGVSFHF